MPKYWNNFACVKKIHPLVNQVTSVFFRIGQVGYLPPTLSNKIIAAGAVCCVSACCCCLFSGALVYAARLFICSGGGGCCCGASGGAAPLGAATRSLLTAVYVHVLLIHTNTQHAAQQRALSPRFGETRRQRAAPALVGWRTALALSL